jgi:hypothetical protein
MLKVPVVCSRGSDHVPSASDFNSFQTAYARRLKTNALLLEGLSDQPRLENNGAREKREQAMTGGQ